MIVFGWMFMILMPAAWAAITVAAFIKARRLRLGAASKLQVVGAFLIFCANVIMLMAAGFSWLSNRTGTSMTVFEMLMRVFEFVGPLSYVLLAIGLLWESSIIVRRREASPGSGTGNDLRTS